MAFRGWPDVKQLPGGEWILQSTLTYELPEELAEDLGVERVVSPAGFVTDFASVPARLRSFVAPLEETTRSAVAHDRLYHTREVSRKAADRIFRVALEEEGIGWWSRWAMWAAVRVGGRAAYEE